MTTVTIGKLIKNARTRAGITQEALSLSLGFKSSQNVSNWERGTILPPTHVYKKLCKKLNISRNAFCILLVKHYEIEVKALLN